MPSLAHRGVSRWHAIFESKEVDAHTQQLNELLHDDVTFHSPVLHRPVEGKLATALYLQAASKVLVNPHWRYVREIVDGADAALEFMTEVDGIVINGVDFITFDDEGRITDFKVMVRPKKAVEKLHQMMMVALQEGGR